MGLDSILLVVQNTINSCDYMSISLIKKNKESVLYDLVFLFLRSAYPHFPK